MSDTITFTFEGIGQVEYTVDQCRELCPTETDAFLAVAQRCQKTMRHGTDNKRRDAGTVFEQRFQALKQAEFAEAHRRNPDLVAQVSSTAEQGEPA